MQDTPVHILLVEDNAADAFLLQNALRESKFGQASFVCSTRLDEALRLLSSARFDIVLVDLNLPDSQGLTTLDLIQKHSRALPIVVLTGLDDEDVARQALQRGAQDYLVKGETHPDSIARALRYAIDRKAAEESLRIREAELAHLSRVTIAGQLASGLAHELNQPLSAILNYAAGTLNMIRRPGVKVEDFSPALEALAMEAKRAGEIVRSLRALVTKQPQARTAADINEIIHQSIDLLAHEFRGANIQIITELDPSLPRIVCVGVQIMQVMINLMRNAVDAMKSEGAVGSNLFIRSSLQDGFVRVDVTDQGCGMSNQQISRVFEPFYTTKEDGMGLGLAICRTIINEYAGALIVRAEIYGGTTFSFTLPVESDEIEI